MKMRLPASWHWGSAVAVILTLVLTTLATVIPFPHTPLPVWDDSVVHPDLYVLLPMKSVVHVLGLVATAFTLHRLRRLQPGEYPYLGTLVFLAMILAIPCALWWFWQAGLGIEIREIGWMGDGPQGQACSTGLRCNYFVAAYWATPILALFLDTFVTQVTRQWRPRFMFIWFSVASVLVQITGTVALIIRMANT